MCAFGGSRTVNQVGEFEVVGQTQPAGPKRKKKQMMMTAYELRMKLFYIFNHC